MKWLILGQMRDLKTGLYIVNTLEEMGEECKYVDIRALAEDNGLQDAQGMILSAVEELKYIPDTVMVLKGAELLKETVVVLKAMFPKANFVNWYYDIQVGGIDVWQNTKYLEVLDLYDYYFCGLVGVAEKLKEVGCDNVYYCGQACYPPLHGPQYANNFQRTKYGEDVSFIGNIGLDVHEKRLKYLNAIVKAGFNMKIWGNLFGSPKNVPLGVRQRMVGNGVINELHSTVCENSLVNLGIDARENLNGSMSARIYKIMCSGGLYLSSPTKGIGDMFKVNKKGEEITADQEVVVFYDEHDLVRVIDFLLEHDDIRESIAKNGQEKVMNEDTFVHRINEIKEVMKK